MPIVVLSAFLVILRYKRQNFPGACTLLKYNEKSVLFMYEIVRALHGYNTKQYCSGTALISIHFSTVSNKQ